MKHLHKNIALAGIALGVLAVFYGSLNAAELDVPLVDPADFSVPMDNLWLPMAIGSTYVYMAEEDDEVILNEITTTSVTKTIMDVPCTVIYDVEWVYIEDLDDWFMTEETDDWLAWDNWGNVWYFGESTVEYIYDDDWNLVSTSTEGSWEGGVDGALPGILMLAQPEPGISYLQEYYEGEAEDRARVLRLNAKVSTELADYEGCLVTKEWTMLDPGVIEHKYYAPGVGLVYIQELKEKTVQVELIEIR